MKDLEPDITFTVAGSNEEFDANLIQALTTYTTVLADAWDEGARWAAVEIGIYPNEKQQWLLPSDNPYRKVSRG